MLPILESQDGFRAYSIAGTENEIFSFSVWDTPEQADAANEAAAGWVADNLADHLTLVEAAFAELLLSTTLNVSPARV